MGTCNPHTIRRTFASNLHRARLDIELIMRLGGWESLDMVQSYVDPGFTGKDDNRPGLNRLLSDAKRGLFEKVVVFKLDRMARNLHLLLNIESKLKECHISLTSVKESIDTSTGTGKMVFQMFGMIAEWERDAIIERTRAGRLQRYKEGCWGPGNPPYGYKRDLVTRKLIIDSQAARTVKHIYEDYASGNSLAQIANRLNSDHIPSRSNHSMGWRPGAVRDIIMNPVYKGTELVNRHTHISDWQQADPKELITISVEPIVNEGLWEIAQSHLKNHKRLQPPRKDKWLLQGLVTCGLCGYSFQTTYRHSTVRTYSCRGRLKYTHLDGSLRCKSPIHDANWLEEEVWTRIEAIINDPNKLELLLRDTIQSLAVREAELSAKIRPIDERLCQIAQQKAKLADKWVLENMDTKRYQDLKRSLDQEETRLKSIRVENDPSQVAELESTRAMLQFWQRQTDAMSWNTENEDGSRIRIVNQPHKMALRIAELEDSDLKDTTSFPSSRRQLLDLLQVRLVVFEDRVEVKALFSIEPICQLYNPA